MRIKYCLNIHNFRLSKIFIVLLHIGKNKLELNKNDKTSQIFIVQLFNLKLNDKI